MRKELSLKSKFILVGVILFCVVLVSFLNRDKYVAPKQEVVVCDTRCQLDSKYAKQSNNALKLMNTKDKAFILSGEISEQISNYNNLLNEIEAYTKYNKEIYSEILGLINQNSTNGKLIPLGLEQELKQLQKLSGENQDDLLGLSGTK